MNERHLFRGKRINDGEWMIGGYAFTAEKHIIFEEYNAKEINEATLGQCTGLRDKNGTLVFEGDIFEIEYYPNLLTTHNLSDNDLCFRLVCQYGCDAAFHLVRLSNGNCYSIRFGGSAVKRVDKIGNIHDNPELLNGERVG